MKLPSEPKTILLKNEFYPKGLTALDVYNYYYKNKNNILKELLKLNKNNLIFYKFNLKENFIVKRNHEGKSIRLNPSNYDNFINGYSVSISYEFLSNYGRTKSFIIDLDPIGKNKEVFLKESLGELIKLFPNNYKIMNSSYGYHFYGEFEKEFSVENIKNELKKILLFKFSDIYEVDTKIKERPNTKVHLDLSSMNKRGTISVPYTLCRNGLICSDITNDYIYFDRKSVKII